MTTVTVARTEQVDIADLAKVYRDVHAPDLHLRDHRDPTIEDRLRWTVEAPGFAATIAHVDNKLAGAVLGCPLPPETLWWRDLGSADPTVTREWAGRTF
ncbi:MAG TPA: N-acetyltransferase, partial [Asanoa sp.]|nr:N-acetyltransferase [Asanoa sp.]